jgi:hypothetical protein
MKGTFVLDRKRGIYSPRSMGFLRRVFDQALEDLRKKGEVPLAVLSYRIDSEDFGIYLLDDVSPEDLNALLEKIGMVYVEDDEK